jgi:3-hydroxyisobutyrate dehydrogenase-like beta-hydroxyacid dehydrogenase
MATLGWIGLGEIGTPMALRLIGAGHRVVVWGRTASRLEPALAAGATAASSPAELASRCDAVMLCVTDGNAVEDVVFGPRGVAEGARRGSLIVDHSTIHPETARLASRRLRSARVGWVDAPVSGGAAGAQAARLAIFLGGEADDVERVRPWIAAYASNVTHMGAVGSGQVAKSCNQAIVASTVGIWAEVIAYARRCGIDPDTLVDALEGGWADSAIRRAHAHDMVAGRFRRAPGLIILKDLDIIGDMARTTASPMPVTSAVTTLYRLLLAQGHATGGFGALMQLYDAKTENANQDAGVTAVTSQPEPSA